MGHVSFGRWGYQNWKRVLTGNVLCNEDNMGEPR